jgi:hypothetical protein
MTARLVILGIIVTAIVAGIALYYAQVYAYYTRVADTDVGGVQLVSVTSGQPEPILYDDFTAIDSDSSPLRFRSCFQTANSLALLSETYRIYDDATPLNGPRWFGCYDAQAIGAALESGEAVAFLAQENIRYGVDRVAAIFPDGRGFEWNQINACGEVVFNGNPAPEGCPPVPESPN